MIWLLLQRLIGATILYENENMSEFRDYCQPSYRFSETGMQLEQLVVVFKQGDRSAHGMGQDWSARRCVESSGPVSYLDRCRRRALTTKGYEQQRQLGRHIQNYYLEAFPKLASISAVSLVPRVGISAVRGVISELKTSVPVAETTAAVSSNTICEAVKKKRLGRSSDTTYPLGVSHRTELLYSLRAGGTGMGTAMYALCTALRCKNSACTMKC